MLVLIEFKKNYCRVGYFFMTWWKTGIAGMREVKNNRQDTFEMHGHPCKSLSFNGLFHIFELTFG